MNNSIRFYHQQIQPAAQSCTDNTFGLHSAQKVRSFHESIPGYKQTPLVDLSALASLLGVSSIKVKDESHRFDLNAFKVLGGSWAVANVIANKLSINPKELTFEKVTSKEAREKVGKLTFVTATDGNHGRGIAWSASAVGQSSVVYLPKGSAKERLDNILALGAKAEITSLCYDDCVRLAAENADKYGWILVQDTQIKDRESNAELIMQGYTTMALEAYEQLADEKPTHIFLQAGVGAMAGAVAAFFADVYKGQDMPIISIIEPLCADCIFKSASSSDGKLHFADSSDSTIMAGLSCAEPCEDAFKILKSTAESFICIPDFVAANGMRILGAPTGNDRRIISGESGAATIGALSYIMQNKSFDEIRRIMNLNETSRILCFSTEGDTDKENYRRIVWDGAYSTL